MSPVLLLSNLAILVCCNFGESAVLKFQQDVGKVPKQIHVAFGDDPTDMVITWSTQSPVTNPVVRFGLEPTITDSTLAVTNIFRDGVNRSRLEYFHSATLKHLIPGRRYSYNVGAANGPSSAVFSFPSMKAGQDWSPHLAVYGDLGLKNAQSLSRIVKDVQARMYDAILHVGDFAYDMADNNSYTGDTFMELLQPVAANVPYMTCPGNHEFHFNFSNYKARFYMPGDGGNMYYSFNIGPMHIISISTEFYYFVFYGTGQLKRQYDWLVKDLEEATKPENRAKRPWIILIGHRPMYCSNEFLACGLLTRLVRNGYFGTFGLEPLLKKFGVDVALWGHQHSYERLWPILKEQVRNGTTAGQPYLDPRAPVHIISGSAGCDERPKGFKRIEPFSAFRSTDYGYGRLQVLNATHLAWQQVSDDQDGKVIDSIVVVRHQHAPF